MERSEREYLLSGADRGVVFGLKVRVPASGLTVTIEGGLIRVGTSVRPAVAVEKVLQQQTLAITASKDAYVYVDSTGAIAKVEVANGAAKPSQATIGENSEFLAKCVSNGSDVTSVQDLSRRGPHGKIHVLSFGQGFVTAEQGAISKPSPVDGRIIALEGTVTVALAGTDAGTATPAIGENDVFANVTGGALSFPLSSAVGARIRAIPTGANYVKAGQAIRLTSAKTTSGGRAEVQVYIEETR